jgi:hypothetical protein
LGSAISILAFSESTWSILESSVIYLIKQEVESVEEVVLEVEVEVQQAFFENAVE